MTNRIKKLTERLNDGQCAVICSPENRFYYTGFESSDGVLLVSNSNAVFLTDSRYIEAAQSKIKSCTVEELHRFSEQVPDFVKSFGCGCVLVEQSRLTLAEFARIKKCLPGKDFISDETLDGFINLQRQVKDGEEVENILKAQAIAEEAFDYIISVIKQGMTEKEIALKLDYKMFELGAQALSFETIVVSGANSSMPHGVPSEKRVENGDFITMDFGAVYNGYHSDMTRTVAAGCVTREQEEVYNTVLSAQTAALELIKAGVTGRQADAAARDIIEKAGYGEYFRHATGHSVGVEIHENPTLSPSNEKPLCAGNVVTVEPGIYIPGKFGVRIEDMCLVEEKSNKNLTRTNKKLTILDN